MSGRFAGRRAIVTGASRGIGAGIAERLAAEGAEVAIVARTLDAHDDPARQPQRDRRRGSARYGNPVGVVAADLTDGDDRARIVPEAVEQLGGPIDILVNNAAAAMYAQPSEMPLKRRRITFEVNVHAPLDLAQAVLPAMLEQGEGWIVNLSSATGQARGRSAVPHGGTRQHHRHVRRVEGRAQPRDQRARARAVGPRRPRRTPSSPGPRS